MIIYTIENLINHKIYIGQTINSLDKRISQHKCLSKTSKKYLYTAIRKYGFSNFEFKTLITANTQLELDAYEKFYIKLFNSANRKCGYNLDLGGNGHGKHSSETIKKISESNRGKTRSEETRNKLIKSHIGIKLSNEAKAKLSEAGKNRIVSNETKDKLSKLHLGKKHSDERKLNNSIAQTGKKLSEETKKKMSDAQKKRRESNKIGDNK